MHQPRLWVSWLKLLQWLVLFIIKLKTLSFLQVQMIARVVKTETEQPAHCCTSTSPTVWMKWTDNATRIGDGQSLARYRQVRATWSRWMWKLSSYASSCSSHCKEERWTIIATLELCSAQQKQKGCYKDKCYERIILIIHKLTIYLQHIPHHLDIAIWSILQLNVQLFVIIFIGFKYKNCEVAPWKVCLPLVIFLSSHHHWSIWSAFDSLPLYALW